ncbi:Rha family transcriptional regulator [uncultured Clostridium sp.]|uniref:Rha family transcriptional regulator n=1 Tax=uncultured Clostridium sp. TaxID=59620 RepID=UPI0025E040A1|nr:Rha family transcriptional regulator [uncultured Clostridium sp.]
MEKTELLKQEIVYNDNLDIKKTKNITNSLLVAQTFEKEHKNVLRDIENILKETTGSDLSSLNFYVKKKQYKDLKGELRPYYEMDKDFFTLLVMGYTGSKAMKFKIDYINKFNQMEQELLRRKETRQTGKTIRFNYTNFIQMVNGSKDKEEKNWSYKTYTDLVYKIVFTGKTAKQKRIELNLKENQNLRDFLTNEENIKVQYWEKFIKDLALSNDWHKLSTHECYHRVKDYLIENNIL